MKLSSMNFSMWLETDPHDWPFGEEFKVYAEVVREGTSIKVGTVKVLYRGLVDVTSALMESEIEKLAVKCAESFSEERAAV